MAVQKGPKGNEIIRMEKVVKKFGDFVALNEVDISVQEGEVVVIIGPSGSGKSTLLRTINQLERHDSGPHRRRRHRAD